MQYNQLGRSGLRVSQFGFGSWITFGKSFGQSEVNKIVRLAFDRGVNLFDTAEAYGQGEAERLLGEALKQFRREEVVVSTKILYGGVGPNSASLSWKHLVEGTRLSLKRLNLEYVDLLFCHRPDPTTPIEESVRAMDYLIRSGHAFYWGTSEWPPHLIEEVHRVCERNHCIPPVAEQPEYNLFARHRVENEYLPLCERYGMGLTTFSPLACGVLTGKYHHSIPKRSRLGQHNFLKRELSPTRHLFVERLIRLAEELHATPAQLALAWCLHNPTVSSVLLGASSPEQLLENLASLRVLERVAAERVKVLGVEE